MKPGVDQLGQGNRSVPAAVSIREQARAIKPRAFSLELTKGCNLRCGYCYYAAREEAYDPRTVMSQEVAERSVDLLLGESADNEAVHLHLFGGEPLLNLPLLRHVVEYGEAQAAARGRQITFEVTTNGTRFSEPVIAFLNQHQIHVGVSFDGPPDVQDRSRPALVGSSHALALPGIRRFLGSRKGTDLMGKTHCSVVITRKELDLVRIVHHLEELGFERIILTPATDLTGSGSHGLSPRDLPRVLEAYDALAADFETRKRDGRPATVTWFDNLLGRLLSGKRKTRFCEGGRDYLGVAADGRVALCYRFYENGEFAMGDVHEGIDRQVTERLLELPLEKKPACSVCWARYFCGGGCHHENLVATGGLGDPNPVTCEILRHSMGRTLEIWARLTRDGKIGGRLPVNGSDTSENTAMNPKPAIDLDYQPRIRASCHVRKVGREHVVYEPVSHEVVILNTTAAFIFAHCDGERTAADLVAAMANRFQAPAQVLERDLLQTLELFRQKSLLQE